MYEVQIIVPREQVCIHVLINGQPGQFLSTVSHSGYGYDVQTWAAQANGPIYDVQFRLQPPMPQPARVR